MKVIVNADDFGFSKGVNLGIAEAYRNGLVRSATMMANMPGFEHGVEVSRQNPCLEIGVHLTLTAGRSLGERYSTITDDQGNLLRLAEVERRANAGTLDLDEVEAEYEAQIQKVLEAGIRPSHFDGHHHTQNLAGVVGVFLKLASKYGVGVRINDKSLLTGGYAGIKTTACFSGDFYGEGATAGNLKAIISGCGGASIEIMSHPAYIDCPLLSLSSYNTKRCVELDVLTGSEVAEFIRENGHQICSFADL